MTVWLARGQLNLDTAPTELPVTLEEAKAHLRVDDVLEDPLIESLISSARAQVEQFTGRALLTQTWELAFPEFPADGVAIKLPMPPLQSVSSVAYIDTAGNAQTWDGANYSVSAPAGDAPTGGLIIPGRLVEYPDTDVHPLAVTITFVAGWATPDDIPQAYKAALLTVLAHQFENRGSMDMPRSASALLQPFRATAGVRSV